VQDFIPAPFDVATAMYYTGLDPFTGKPVETAKHLRDRKLQRALMQFFKPENYFEVREALIQAKRQDLIGDGCDALIPAVPPPKPNSVAAKTPTAASRATLFTTQPSPNHRAKARKSNPAANREKDIGRTSRLADLQG
jgi:hypothetical protein